MILKISFSKYHLEISHYGFSFAAKRGEYIYNTQVMMTIFAAKRRKISPRNAEKFRREISLFSRCFSEKLSISRLLFSRFAEKNALFKLR